MGAQKTGLTLEGLADRLETLERENERMRSENAELRQEVSALRGSETRRDGVSALRSSDRRGDEEPESSEPDALVSRKSLLSKAGAAAVVAMAAGTLLYPREAKAHHFLGDPDYDSLQVGMVSAHRVRVENDNATDAVRGTTSTDVDSNEAGVYGLNEGAGPGVGGSNNGSGPAVLGTANGSGGTGVKGTGRYGVWGESTQAGFYGVFGRNNRTDGTGVRGVGAKTGVLGESTSGMGVKGTSSAASLGAVEGHNDGGGAGVAGVGKVGMLAFSHTNGWIGVWGRHTANGYGVAGDSAQGVGVSGESTSGYGGLFGGGKAQLRLKPASTAGKPTSGTHSIGELYMDSRATLFVCVADGSPGTWKKLAFATTA